MADNIKETGFNAPDQEDQRESIATINDWITHKMPKKHVEFSMQRVISPEQLNILKKGHIPEEMEDKWFWYMDGNKLSAHRSWTGDCIFIIQFDGDILHVTANRDPKQYRNTSIQYDITTINDLLDWWSQPTYDYYGNWLVEIAESLSQDAAE